MASRFERIELRHAVTAVGAAGLGYAALDALLYAAGHSPSVTLVPIPQAEYYLWQAVFVIPLLFVLWLVFGFVAHAIAKRGGATRVRKTLAIAGMAYGGGLLVAFLLPDFVAYFARGFDAMGWLIRITAPLSAVTIVGLCAVGLRAVHGLGWGRAVGASWVGFIVQALLGSPLLR